MEQKKKLKKWKRIANLGNHAKPGNTPWNKGVPRTEVELKNISDGIKKWHSKNEHPKGMLGKHHSDGVKKRIRKNSNTLEIRRKRRESFLEYCRGKRVLFCCGVCGRELMITRKRSRTQKYCSYECLGKSKRTEHQRITEKIRSIKEYSIWRTSIFERDNYVCTKCKDVHNNRLQAHHLIPLSVLVRENSIKTREEAILSKPIWDMDNAVTLCEACHRETDSYLRKYKE